MTGSIKVPSQHTSPPFRPGRKLTGPLFISGRLTSSACNKDPVGAPAERWLMTDGLVDSELKACMMVAASTQSHFKRLHNSRRIEISRNSLSATCSGVMFIHPARSAATCADQVRSGCFRNRAASSLNRPAAHHRTIAPLSHASTIRRHDPCKTGPGRSLPDVN